MKVSTLILSLLLGLSLFTCSAPSMAGLFGTMAASDWPVKKVSGKYKLETYGYDARAYEWTPKHNKKVSCVLIAGSSSSTGVACYPKDKEK